MTASIGRGPAQPTWRMHEETSHLLVGDGGPILSVKRRVLAVEGPLPRVIDDVLPNGIQLTVVANHPLVESLLPQPLVIRRPALLLDPQPVLPDRHGLEPPYHITEGRALSEILEVMGGICPLLDLTLETHAIPCRDAALVRVPGPFQHDDAVHMVRHHDKGVEMYPVVHSQFLPHITHHRPWRREMHLPLRHGAEQGAASVNTDGDEVITDLGVVVALQAGSAPGRVGGGRPSGRSEIGRGPCPRPDDTIVARRPQSILPVSQSPARPNRAGTGPANKCMDCRL